MKYIKLILTSLFLVGIFSIGNAAADSQSSHISPYPTVIANAFVSDTCQGLTGVSSTATCNSSTSTSTVKGLIKTVVNILSFGVGIVSVIVIIFAGFRFITAGSDSNAVASAKNMLIYAIVGVAIAVLSQVIVHYVLNTASNNVTGFNNHSYISKDS